MQVDGSMLMSARARRLRRVFAEYGATGMCFLAVSRAWNRIARHRQRIYELPASRALDVSQIPRRATVEVYQRVDDIPASVMQQLCDEEWVGSATVIHTEFRAGATVFALRVADELASVAWSKRGADVQRWYIPVEANDVILYGWQTKHHYKGRGLITNVLQAAIKFHSALVVRRFLADVRVWNRPSIRVFERLGFARLCERPPLD